MACRRRTQKTSFPVQRRSCGVGDELQWKTKLVMSRCRRGSGESHWKPARRKRHDAPHDSPNPFRCLFFHSGSILGSLLRIIETFEFETKKQPRTMGDPRLCSRLPQAIPDVSAKLRCLAIDSILKRGSTPGCRPSAPHGRPGRASS